MESSQHTPTQERKNPMKPAPEIVITDQYGDEESNRLIALANGIEIDILSDEDGLCVTVHQLKTNPDGSPKPPFVEFSHDWLE